MMRIGILGSENSRAKAFAEIINQSITKIYPDFRVTAIYGEEPKKSKEIQDSYGVERVVQTPQEMLGNVDAVMVTACDGTQHPALAYPFIEAKIPVFLDKLAACTAKEAADLVRFAKKRGVPLCGGSGIRYAYDVLMMQNIAKAAKNAEESIAGEAAAPLSTNNAYGGVSFSAAQLVEMTLAVFGSDPVSVSAWRKQDNAAAIIHYAAYDVINRFQRGKQQYTLRLNRNGHPVFMEVDISMICRRECAAFVKMLRTGKMEQSYEALVLPVCCINAMEQAYRSGTSCRIEKPVLQ